MAKVLQQSDGILSFDIFVNGTKIQDSVEVDSIFIYKEVNKIPTATILIEDGGAIGLVNEPYANSEGNDFIPGNDIEIFLGYNNDRQTAFKGIVVSQRLMVKRGKSQLSITCKDKAVNMTKGRFNAIYKDSKDSDAIQSLAGKYSISTDLDSSAFSASLIMQYNCSDWDFIIVRAEMNNMLVLANDNKLAVKKVSFSDSPQFEINSSQFIIDMDLSLDSESLADSYQLSSWSEKDQKATEVSVNLSDSLAQGNISGVKMSGDVNGGKSNRFTSASLSEDELKSWGDSLVTKAVLSKVQGKIIIPGTTEILPGELITLSGFSARFNGKAFVSSVSHELEDGDWITILSIGMNPVWHSSLPDVEDLSASGLIPGAAGVQIGKVKQIDSDPDNNYRVLVTLPSFSGTDDQEGIWCRLAFPYASADSGFFFFPEVDDEVLISFVNNDPRFPVITGAVYSSKNKPKETPDNKNQFKSIYSKSGIYIKFDDTDKILTIETPGSNSFTLDDKNKKIEISDSNGSTVKMDSSGVSIDSSKDIKLSATGNVDISATNGITLKANADVSVKGLNIENSAQVGFTGKGNATAEVSASGQTTIKGAMVMIN